MELPHNSRELTKIFKAAITPEITEFDGEYSVDMLTGPLPNLKKYSHRKIFHPINDKVIGCNLLFKKTGWGYFFLEGGICREVDSLGIVVINYNTSANRFIFRRITDYVRRIDASSKYATEGTTTYIGRFNYLFMGKLYFLGWFSLQDKP